MNALPASAVGVRHRAWGLPHVSARGRGLWSEHDFLRLFASQTVSLFGSEITLIALPLTAVLVLGASPAQMGLLAAVSKAPYILVGLLAGVWVDRLRCRTVPVAADVGRAVLLGSIPVAAAFGVLRIEQLFIVAFLAGLLTLFFDVAYQSYLPELVTREQLPEGNSKLEASKSFAELIGPVMGSALLQIAAAPFAIGVDALSFVASGAFLRSIRTSAAPVPSAARPSVLAEVAEGIRIILKHPLLRPIAACSATMNLFYQMLMAVYVLYVTTQLHLSPGYIGIVLGIGNGAGLIGAVLSTRIAGRIGMGRTLVASTLVTALGGMLVALAHPDAVLTLPALILGQLVMMLGVPIYNINQVSMRQSITPPGIRGRVNATTRCLVWSTMPIGSLMGGALGETLGLQETIAIAAFGMLLAGLWVWLSPVRTLTAEKIAALTDLA